MQVDNSGKKKKKEKLMCTTTKHRDRVRRIPRRKITSRFGGREGVKTGQEGRHRGDTGRGMWRWSRVLEEIEGEARWAGGAGWEGAAHAHSQPPTCACQRTYYVELSYLLYEQKCVFQEETKNTK